MNDLESRMHHYDTVPAKKADDLTDELHIPSIGTLRVLRPIAHDRGRIYKRVGDKELLLEPISTPTMQYGYKVHLLE